MPPPTFLFSVCRIASFALATLQSTLSSLGFPQQINHYPAPISGLSYSSFSDNMMPKVQLQSFLRTSNSLLRFSHLMQDNKLLGDPQSTQSACSTLLHLLLVSSFLAAASIFFRLDIAESALLLDSAHCLSSSPGNSALPSNCACNRDKKKRLQSKKWTLWNTSNDCYSNHSLK